MSRFNVYYSHPDHGDVVAALPEHWGIDQVARGFWVTESGYINFGLNEMTYWIPPSQLRYVEHVVSEGRDEQAITGNARLP